MTEDQMQRNTHLYENRMFKKISETQTQHFWEGKEREEFHLLKV